MILRVESSGRTVLPLLIFMIVFLQPITDDTSLQLRLSEDEDDLSSEKATRIADDTSLQLRLSEDEDDLSSEKAKILGLNTSESTRMIIPNPRELAQRYSTVQ